MSQHVACRRRGLLELLAEHRELRVQAAGRVGGGGLRRARQRDGGGRCVLLLTSWGCSRGSTLAGPRGLIGDLAELRWRRRQVLLIDGSSGVMQVAIKEERHFLFFFVVGLQRVCALSRLLWVWISPLKYSEYRQS